MGYRSVTVCVRACVCVYELGVFTQDLDRSACVAMGYMLRSSRFLVQALALASLAACGVRYDPASQPESDEACNHCCRKLSL